MRKRRKKVIKSLCCSMLCTLMISEMPVYAFAQKTKVENYTNTVRDMRLWYDEPGPIAGNNRMLEGKLLPLGNGTIGGSVFGGVEKERIHFNDKTLWTGGPDNADGTMNNGTKYQGGNRLGEFNQEAYENIVNRFDSNGELVATGNNTGVSSALFSNRSNLGSWQDFGDIYVDFSENGSTENNVRNYERDLDLNDATAEVGYNFKGTNYKREYFVSYPDNVLVARFTKEGPDKLNFNVELQKSSALNSSNANISVDDENDMIRLIGTLNGNKMNYTASLKVIAVGEGNKVEEKNNTLQVNNADEVILILSTGTDYENVYPSYRTGETNKEVTSRIDRVVEAAAKKGYDKLKENHIEDYKSLFDRVDLDLNERLPNIPTNEVIQNYRNGNYNKALEVLVFQYGRYLTIASSRQGSLPSNLAGLWSIGSPLWSGDYHFNVNVQMNYWPAFSTNLAECGKVFSDYMKTLVIPGRKSAEMSIGAKTENFETTPIGEGNGFMVHTANNPFGQTSPNGEEYYGWNPNGGTWALQNAFEYYEFTQDKDYLESTIYPMVKEVANMWVNKLIESKSQKIDGTDDSRLVVAPSTSAEQGPMTIGSTYDQSLVWEIFEKAIIAAEVLNLDSEYVDKWKEVQSKLDPIDIGQEGQIKEWYQETTIGRYLNNGISTAIPAFNRDYDGESHRHISNLIGLFPGTLINKDNKEEIEAAKVSLLSRGFKATGWSKGHKINLWARTLDGENTYKTVQSMLSTNYAGIMDNLLDSHGFGKDHEDSPAFQIEGNFGYTSGIAEMLLQSQLGYIQFLPAIPKEWSDGKVSGLVARGNFIISEEWQNGIATEFTVKYNAENEESEFTGEYTNIKNAKVYEDGEEIDVLKDENNDRITFTVKKGKVYKIDLSNSNSHKIIESAESLLADIHEDLLQLRKELSGLIESAKADLNADNIKELSVCMQKANVVNSIYPKILECDGKVYLISGDKGLKQSDIDKYYVDINEIKKRAIENNSNTNIYITDKSNIESILSNFNSELSTNNISFSKESGEIDINNPTVSLSKQENEYTIRYTTDGTEPVKTSKEYIEPIQLSIEDDNVIRAALFKGEQRVSYIFSKKYTNKNINIKTAFSDNYYGNLDTYSPEKAIDSDLSTRWATNNNTKSVDIELKFNNEEVISALKFVQFVSNHNWSDTYEIKALQNGEYVTIKEGSKLGDMDQRDSDVVGPDSGYYSTKFIEFTPVETNSIIISITRCNEPSFFSIDAYNLSSVDQDKKGNIEELNNIIEKSEAIDKEDPLYKDAEPLLKSGFDFALDNAKVVIEAKQSVIDSRALYLTRYFNRLGFGDADKTELFELINLADEKVTSKEYSRDSRYNLNKVLVKAKELASNEDSKQPDIEKIIGQLREAIDFLEETLVSEKLALEKGQQEGIWAVVPSGENVGNYYSTYEGSKLIYEFTGNSVQIFGVKYSDHGIAKFILKKDGEIIKEEIVDCYEVNRDWNTKLIEWSDLEVGTYSLEIVHYGKNQAASNKYVEVKEIITTNYKDEVEVDKSKLEELINLCADINEENFTKESFSKFKIALDKAKEVIASGDTCNAEIEDTITSLVNAKENLIPKENIDTSELESELEIAKAVSKDGYTEESFEELEKIIADIEAFLNGDMTSSEVEVKLSKLKDAINNLRADKSELIDLYERYINLEQGNYTDTTWNLFIEALVNTKVIIDKVDATPSEVMQAKENIISAVYGLVEKEDTVFNKHLVIAVEEAKKVTEDELSNVVPAVVEEFKSALIEAKAILTNSNANQELVDKAFDRLSKAMQMLAFEKGNKEALISLVDKINKLNGDIYIKSTWNDLQKSLAASNSVIEDINAMEKEISESYEGLLRAFLKLRLRPSKDKLEDLINKAEGIDLYKYTEKSLNNMNNALRRAREVCEDEEATVDEITAVSNDLQIAISNLESKESGNSGNNGNSGDGVNKNESANGKLENENIISSNKKTANSKLPNTGGRSTVAVGLLGIVTVVVGTFLYKKKAQ